jgi:glycosyltransferase involved in cell wall biosynthesis
MSVPFVSIVMPVYNALPYLEQAIQSIYTQTVTDWELIAVDDCSTDGSREYMEKIDDPRFKLFRNGKNMKHSYTCNRGTSLATGKYIAKMDADDMMMPYRLEKQLSMLESNHDIDVVGCGLFRILDNGHIIAVRRPPSEHRKIAHMFTGIRAFANGPNFSITNGALVGRTPWFQQWKYDVAIPYAQDFDLICRSRSHSTFGNVSDPLYIYRIGSGETSSWTNQTKAVYYKTRTIIRHALRPGMLSEAGLGLAALMTRPLAYAGIKIFVHTGIGSNKLFGANVAPEDAKDLREGLEQISRAVVPLKCAIL